MTNSKTTEEIDALKANWLKDPCWDIEDTEEFEEYHDQLLAWREDLEVKHRLAAEARKELRLEKVKQELGIVDEETALSIYTFHEIENDLNRAERLASRHDQDFTHSEMSQLRKPAPPSCLPHRSNVWGISFKDILNPQKPITTPTS